MNDKMKTFFKIVFVGLVFLLGFILIHLLPEATFDEGFKDGLRVGWVFVYVLGIIGALCE